MKYVNGGVLTFEEHKKHIDNQSPIVAALYWGDGAHAVVCSGYKIENNINYLYLINPAPGKGNEPDFYTYDSLVTITGVGFNGYYDSISNQNL